MLTFILINYIILILVFVMPYRLLFYSTNLPTRVYKASLDGTDVTEMVSTTLSNIYGLSIDGTSRICWGDYSKYHVTASINVYVLHLLNTKQNIQKVI